MLYSIVPNYGGGDGPDPSPLPRFAKQRERSLSALFAVREPMPFFATSYVLHTSKRKNDRAPCPGHGIPQAFARVQLWGGTVKIYGFPPGKSMPDRYFAPPRCLHLRPLVPLFLPNRRIAGRVPFTPGVVPCGRERASPVQFGAFPQTRRQVRNPRMKPFVFRPERVQFVVHANHFEEAFQRVHVYASVAGSGSG